MIRFGGINFRLLNYEDVINPKKIPLFVVTANAEMIVKYNEDDDFRNAVQLAEFTFDGEIPFRLAKLKTKRNDFKKLSGSDLIFDICKFAAQNEQKVFFLGGYEESNILAQVKMKQRFPGLNIAGWSPPFSSYPFSESISIEICSLIREFKPDYIFVGFGAGKQEFFISDNFDFFSSINVKLIIGSGGSFEFVSGKIKRAPVWIQKLGLEGIFRLAMEPKLFRLKRILLSFRVFKYYFKN